MPEVLEAKSREKREEIIMEEMKDFPQKDIHFQLERALREFSSVIAKDLSPQRHVLEKSHTPGRERGNPESF